MFRIFKNQRIEYFLQLAHHGKFKQVLKYLEKHPKAPLWKNKSGSTALHQASSSGHSLVVSLLLTRGADVHALDHKGKDALYLASEGGHVDVVKLLAERITDASKLEPMLALACERGYHDLVEFVLQKSSLNQKNMEKALKSAVQHKHAGVVDSLLRRASKRSSLYNAIAGNDSESFDLLLSQGSEPNIASKSGFTPLHYAVHYNSADIVKLLVDKVDVNAKSKTGITPLHVSASEGKDSMMELLLEKGANVHNVTNDGLTALHCAAKHGHLKGVETLIQAGSSVHQQTNRGFTPLHLTLQHNHLACSSALLTHKASLSSNNNDGLGPLHLCAYFNHIRAAEFVINNCCDMNAKSNNGMTPLDIACKLGHKQMQNFLKSHGAIGQETNSQDFKEKTLPLYTPISSVPSSLQISVEQFDKLSIHSLQETRSRPVSMNLSCDKINRFFGQDFCQLKSSLPEVTSIKDIHTEQQILEKELNELLEKEKSELKTEKVTLKKRIRKQTVWEDGQKHVYTRVEGCMDEVQHLPFQLQQVLLRLQEKFMDKTNLI